ncbi:MAG: type II toxin-antitoxin system HicB family antitoxin [Candidatus Obscuribacterales bacterium]
MSTVNVAVFADGDWIVALCLELDVATQGTTEEEAIANLREALTLQFIAPSSSPEPAPAPPSGSRLLTLSLPTGAGSSQS